MLKYVGFRHFAQIYHRLAQFLTVWHTFAQFGINHFHLLKINIILFLIQLCTVSHFHTLQSILAQFGTNNFKSLKIKFDLLFGTVVHSSTLYGTF